MGVDSTLAGLWARILRAGARRPVTMATLLLAGSSALAQENRAPSNSASPALPTCCDCVPGKFPTLSAFAVAGSAGFRLVVQ